MSDLPWGRPRFVRTDRAPTAKRAAEDFDRQASPRRTGASAAITASARFAAVSLISVLLSGAAALAAGFELSSGERFEGVVAQITPEHLIVETDDGVRLLRRTEIAAVSVKARPDGREVSGGLLGWRDGVFALAMEDGAITAREVATPGTPPAAARDLPSPDAARAARRLIRQVSEGTSNREPVDAPAPGGDAPLAEAGPPAIGQPPAAVGGDPGAATPTPAQLFSSPAVPDRGEDVFRVLAAAPEFTDAAPEQDPSPRALIADGAQPDEAPSAPQVAAGSSSAPQPFGGVFGALSAPSLAETALSQPVLSEPASPAAARAAPDAVESFVLVNPDSAPEHDVSDAAAPESDSATANPVLVADAAPTTAEAPRREALAEAPGVADPDEMRGLLSDLIFGGAEQVAAPQSQPVAPPVAAPLATERPSDQPSDAAAAIGASGLGVETGSIAPLDADRTAPRPATGEETAGAMPPSGDAAAIESQGAAGFEQATPEDAQASVGRAAEAAAAARPAQEEYRRRFDEDFRYAVRGVAPTGAVALSCAGLTRLDGPPLAANADRIDPTALLFAATGDVTRTAAAALAQSWYRSGAVTFDVAAEGDMLRISQNEARLTHARSVGTLRAEDATARLAEGQVDATLSFGKAGQTTPSGALIGFGAGALAAHPDLALESLTASEIAALLTGRIDDWSMVSPAAAGTPTLYLPSLDSPVLQAVQTFASVRRVRPASVRYIPDPSERVAAAMADPTGLVIASQAALEAAAPLGVGRPGRAVSPSLDALRSGAYPLTLPIYVSVSADPGHPATRAFADFLASPAGQRAAFDAGLAPVAACDPSTCSLSAPGLDEARQRLRDLAAATPLLFEQRPVAGGATLESFVFPEGDAPTPETLVRRMESFLADTGALLLARGDAVTVSARLGVEPLRAEAGRVRAESVALALRCAGVPAGVAFTREEEAAPAPGHTVKVILE